MTTSRAPRARSGLSLTELMASVAIIGLLAVMAVQRVTGAIDEGKATSCHVNQAEIELQARLWLRVHGGWPATDLSDIGADTDYFPEGVPTCPVDGSNYSINATTGEVIGHVH